MVEKKLQNLKKLINGLDQQRLQNSYKIDSISLISENLSRTKQYSLVKKSKDKEKQLKKIQTFTPASPGLIKSFHLKLGQKSMSIKQPPPQIKSPAKFIKQNNQNNKNKIIKIARRLYVARTDDMGIKHTQTGQTEFIKTFTMKNSKNGEYNGNKIDLSGLNLSDKSLRVARSILPEFEIIDLSRNLLNCDDLLNIRNSKILKQLVLKNCGMTNEELCKLFNILLNTNIKILNISSPDLKGRNNLTRYDQLYNLIQGSLSLQCLQLSNIQVSPQCQIFTYAKKSKTLKRINLSKNTGVVGICKNIQDLNLSWNGIKKPYALRCPDSNIAKLDLTGNIIPSYLFQQFLTTSNFPVISTLILNKIAISDEGVWLQALIQKTKTLKNLSLVSCQLSKNTFLNVIYGLESNRSIRVLNLSSNKIPSMAVAESFCQSLQKCHVTHLYLQECDIRDQHGAIIFKALKVNKHIQFIDISKNNISQKTGQTICRCLKNSCYNLLSLITEQNFMKYDQIKEIVGYINRNIYMSRMKIREQHRTYKNMNQGMIQITKKLQQTGERLEQIRQQTSIVQDEYLKKQKESTQLDIKIFEQKVKIMKQQQDFMQKKINLLERQIRILSGQKLDEENGNQNPQINQNK